MAAEGVSDGGVYNFKVSGYLVDRLGLELIPNIGVGLSEIIKNAYDADATEVEVHLGGAFNANLSHTAIMIRDNGFGMSLEDLTEKFLNVATEHKKGQRTPRGRWCLGRKGIGRFAVHRLGHELTLYTRAEDSPEYKMTINWDEFSGDRNIGDIDISIAQVVDDNQFGSNSTGTLLVIKRLREKFDGNAMQEVKRSIQTIVSPFGGVSDFEVSIVVPPEYEDYDFMQINPQEIAEKAHFLFRASLDGTGQIAFEYRCNHPWSPNNGRTETGVWKAKKLLGRKPKVSDVQYSMFVFHRTAKLLKVTGVSKKILDDLVGVRLFRNGLRVYPYGDRISKDQIDDWLNLASSRLQDNKKWISHEQVIGSIQFSQESNPELKDKTDRAGLVQNEEFDDLFELSRAIIKKMTMTFIQDDKRKAPPALPSQPPQSTLSFEPAQEPTGTPPTSQPDVPAPTPQTFVPMEMPTGSSPSVTHMSEDLRNAREKVRAASSSLQNILSTVTIDQEGMIEAITEAESALKEARDALEG